MHSYQLDVILKPVDGWLGVACKMIGQKGSHGH